MGKYRDVSEQLEPTAAQFALASEQHIDVSMLSIAISLKRIADVLQGDDKNTGLVPAIYDAVNAVVART